MLIALDYDDTYTRDPDFWDQVIWLGKTRGHSFVCVTGRSALPGAHERQIPMPVVLAGDETKKAAAYRAGFAVNVWIDDMPGTIERLLKLDWSTPG